MQPIWNFFGATLGTNLLYLWLNSCLARKAAYAANRKQNSTCQWLAHSRAIQIVRDMKAVAEVKDQFTLADVLPSSLECSERNSCCQHSNNSNQPSQVHHNSSLRLPPIHNNEKTIVNDEDQLVEIIDVGAAGGGANQLGGNADDQPKHLVLETMEVREERKDAITTENDSSHRAFIKAAGTDGTDNIQHERSVNYALADQS